MTHNNKQKKMSKILLLHYWKLIYRSALFLAALVIYIIYREDTMGFIAELRGKAPVIFALIWGVLALEMVLRFIMEYRSSLCFLLVFQTPSELAEWLFCSEQLWV